MAVVINVTIDDNLKQAGDKVLQREGLTLTAAVTALYEHLASTQELPEFLKDKRPIKLAAVANKRKASQIFTGCAHVANKTDISLDEIRRTRLSRQ